LAALAAPRPLLISNTDKDSIFPLGGVMRIYESTRRLYKLLDAEKNIGLQISEGPHKDTQPLNAGAFHWFERFLKGADPMAVIKEPAVAMFKPEELRVFTELPKDEINTHIDETFVPGFTPPPVPQTKEEWTKMKGGWMKSLGRLFAEREQPKEPLSSYWSLMMEQPRLWPPPSLTAESEPLKEPQDFDVWLTPLIRPGFPAWQVTVEEAFAGTREAIQELPPMLFMPVIDRTELEPESAGLPDKQAWRRRWLLCGTSVEEMRVSEVRRLLKLSHRLNARAILHGTGDLGAIALYASLMQEGAAKLDLRHLPSSHMQGPAFPGILKFMDIPQALAMAAERGKVRITGRREDWAWALQTAEKMGFAANLEIVPALEVVETKKIWDGAPHNAFTSLTRYKDAWYCTFREGSAHVPGLDGGVRVLTSKDGAAWESAALLTETGVDLRDPKFCTMEDGRLMLSIGGSFYDGSPAAGSKRKLVKAHNRVSFTTDGRTWSAPQPACEENHWLWRVTQRSHGLPYYENDPRGVPAMFYGMSYPVNTPEAKAKLSLWESSDGVTYKQLPSPDPGKSLWLNETTLRFDERGNMMALARSDRKGTNAFFGISRPPFKEWSWTDTGHTIGGPDFIRLKDGRMFYGGRDFVNGKANTTVGYLSPAGMAMPLVVLPSGGDCSYPGLAEGPDGQLFVSYYSSHEGKTAIYFARLKVAK
ncbi:MAG TPA: sialidase family protein, partial [Verrucomicrobiales bacterium]|nr:sialidase family protein [Verrucomicrobiales bacterium]